MNGNAPNPIRLLTHDLPYFTAAVALLVNWRNCTGLTMLLVLSSSSRSGSSLSSSLLLARGSYIKGWTIGACKYYDSKINLQACSVSPVDTLVLAVAGKKHSCCSSFLCCQKILAKCFHLHVDSTLTGLLNNVTQLIRLVYLYRQTVVFKKIATLLFGALLEQFKALFLTHTYSYVQTHTWKSSTPQMTLCSKSKKL